MPRVRIMALEKEPIPLEANRKPNHAFFPFTIENMVAWPSHTLYHTLLQETVILRQKGNKLSHITSDLFFTFK